MSDASIIAPPHESPWQPVALGARLAPGGIQPIRLNGRDLVLWRAENGELAIWEDRCPHRGMKLSCGAVREASLLCPYHGWTFGIDGQCHHIPAHPHIKPSKAMRPVIFQARQSQGIVWAHLGEAAGEIASLPALEACATPVRTLHLGLPAEAIAARLPRARRVPGPMPLHAGEIAGAAFAVLIQDCDASSCALHVLSTSAASALAVNSAFTLFRLELEDMAA